MQNFDVAIIGGGIIGGSIAVELASNKLRVGLFEANDPGREASWAAAGMLSPAPDSPDAIPLVGIARASLDLYPEYVQRIEALSSRKVGFRHEGAIEAIFSGDAERELSTLIALHHGLGLRTEPLRVAEAREIEPALSHEIRAAALMPSEACVDNRALTSAVLAAAKSSGVTVRHNCAVTALIHEQDRAAGVIAGGERFAAGHVVLAAGCWSGGIGGLAGIAPTHPVRGQMAALLSPGPAIRRVVRSANVYIVPRDDASPQKLVAGSTIENAGFVKQTTAAGIAKILSGAIELAPSLAHAQIAETWSGLRPGTPDHLPVLGPAEMEGLIVATGHYRNGILLTPITTKLVREWILNGRTSMAVENFSPLRFAATRQASSENQQPASGQ